MSSATHAEPLAYANSLSSLSAYAALAPYYDRFTAGQRYDHWLTEIESVARANGVRGRRLLDVACGTGKSCEPLLARGYDVTACDLSPDMVEVARERLGLGEDRVFCADMRALPSLGRFDLITCLDDAINYLLTDQDLTAAFQSVAAALRPGGLYAFDVNTVMAYRTAFSQTFASEVDDVFFCWRGQGDGSAEPGCTAVATIEVFARSGEDRWHRHESTHEQRHHSRATIERCLAAAGLALVDVYGQLRGGRLVPDPDEDVHHKVVYLAGDARRARRSAHAPVDHRHGLASGALSRRRGATPSRRRAVVVASDTGDDARAA